MLFISFKISSHFFLLAACSVAAYLVHPDADLFHSQDVAHHVAHHRMLSGTAAAGPAAGIAAVPSAALEKLPHRSLWWKLPQRCSCCVSISFCKNWLSALRGHVPADALDHRCLVLDVRGNCLLLVARPSACPAGQLHRFLDALELAAAFSVMCFALYGGGAFSMFALFTLSLSYCCVSLDCEVHVLHDHHHLLSLDFGRCADGLQLPSVLPSLLVSTGFLMSVTGRGLLGLIVVPRFAR